MLVILLSGVGLLAYGERHRGGGEFLPMLVALIASVIFLRSGQSGGGAAAGWNDWLILSAFIPYLIFSRWGSDRGFFGGFAAVAGLGTLFQSGVVLLQFSGAIVGHPLSELSSGWVPGLSESAAGYISGTMPTRTSAAAVFNAMALLILSIGVWGKVGAGWRIVSIWTACVLVSASFLCQSRAGILGLSAGGLAFVICALVVVNRYPAGRLVHGLGLCLAFFTLLATLSVKFYTESWSIRNKFTSLHDDSYRMRLWSEVVHHFNPDNILSGVGPGNFHRWSRIFSGAGTGGDPVYLHNDWMQLIVEHGAIVGAAVVLLVALHLAYGLVLCATRSQSLAGTWSWPRSTAVGTSVGGVCASFSLLVHGFFDWALHIPAVIALLGISLGAAVSGARATPVKTGWWIAPVLLIAAGLSFFWVVFRDAHDDLVVWRAEKLRKGGHLEQSWEKLQQGRSDSPALLREMGEVAKLIGLGSGDWNSRQKWLRKAAEKYLSGSGPDLSEPTSLREAGLCLSISGDLAGGEKLIRNSISKNPNAARGYEYLGVCLQRQGRVAEARRAYYSALRLGGGEIATVNLVQLEKYQRKDP